MSRVETEVPSTSLDFSAIITTSGLLHNIDSILESPRIEPLDLGLLFNVCGSLPDIFLVDSGNKYLVSGNLNLCLAKNFCNSWLLFSKDCLLYTSPSPRDGLLSRMPSSA